MMATLIMNFLVAFGVVIGGSILGGIGAILTLQAPAVIMVHWAEKIKIWALVVAVGGTIDPLRMIESHFLEGELSPVIRQIFFIISAFLGAHMGTTLILWMCKGGSEQ